MAGGTITRDDLITKEALDYGIELSKNINLAIKSQEDLLKAAQKFSNLAKDFKNVKLDKDFANLRKEEAKATQDAVKAQIALEKANQAAIQTNIKLRCLLGAGSA